MMANNMILTNSSIYQPDLKAFREIGAGEVNLIPIYRVFPADLETPVTVYIKMMDSLGPSFLLESVEGGEQVGRYSFVGVNPRGIITLQGNEISIGGDMIAEGQESQARPLAKGEDILDVLKAELCQFQTAELPGLPRFSGGSVGYLGYDVVRFFEQLPESAERVLSIPDAVFLLADTLVIFDHARHQLMILANAFLNKDGEVDLEMAYLDAIQRIERVSEKLLRPLPAIPARRSYRNGNSHGPGSLSINKSQSTFEEMVIQAKEYIAAGDIFQAVLSQRLSRKTDAHPFAIYRALRMLNPSPYMFYFDFGQLGFQVIGASPEMHVRLEDGVASVRPIAGTRWRGKSESEVKALENELLADKKERAEHVMLVD
ncbi:MAG TPA: anthranilate synthase component I, partial [Chloroflexi bacterium]|nr:anthranilate synthase component I [Chloroflexota bacterium]